MKNGIIPIYMNNSKLKKIHRKPNEKPGRAVSIYLLIEKLENPEKGGLNHRVSLGLRIKIDKSQCNSSVGKNSCHQA